MKIDTSSAKFTFVVAQLAHFGWGALIVANAFLLGHMRGGFAVLMCWVIVKEFAFDLIVEDDGIPNGFIDAFFYFAGALVQLALLKWVW